MESQLHDLPTTVVELSHLQLLADAPALLSSIAGFGRVIAPRVVAAEDLSLEALPGNLMARQTLCFSLRLGARLAIQSAEELEVPLGRLVEAADVETTLIEQQLLRVKLTPNIDQRCKYTSCYIPPSFSGNAVVTVRAVSVARRPEMGLTF